MAELDYEPVAWRVALARRFTGIKARGVSNGRSTHAQPHAACHTHVRGVSNLPRVIHTRAQVYMAAALLSCIGQPLPARR